MAKSFLIDRRILVLVLVLYLLSCISALAENITMDIKPSIPIIIYYGNNKSVEVRSSKLLDVPQPVNVCLKQFYNRACIRVENYNHTYVRSISTKNSLLLFVSNISITVYNVSVTIEKLASGEALLMLIELRNNTILNASIGSIYLLSRGVERNATGIAFLKVKNNILYLSLNYEKGHLPFIKFQNNDTIEALLYVNKGFLRLIVVLNEEKRNNEYMGESYTRITEVSSTSPSSVSMYKSITRSIPTKTPIINGLIRIFSNPLFIFTTILLIMSLILYFQINNMLNK